MAYSITLANRVREYLAEIPHITVEEKAMFGGLAFLVNDKMCINIGEDCLMCRFDPKQTEEIAERQGFSPVVMRGKELSGNSSPICLPSSDVRTMPSRPCNRMVSPTPSDNNTSISTLT